MFLFRFMQLLSWADTMRFHELIMKNPKEQEDCHIHIMISEVRPGPAPYGAYAVNMEDIPEWDKAYLGLHNSVDKLMKYGSCKKTTVAIFDGYECVFTPERLAEFLLDGRDCKDPYLHRLGYYILLRIAEYREMECFGRVIEEMRRIAVERGLVLDS